MTKDFAEPIAPSHLAGALPEGGGPDDSGPEGVGPTLRAARERAGLTVDELARKTRISRRQIVSIEASRFDELPARVYAIGFAKTYAKAVGLDQRQVAAMVRAELGEAGEAPALASHFTPGDPARLPGRGLVWFSVLALALLAAGLFVAARELFAPAAQLPPIQQPAAARDREESPPASGPAAGLEAGASGPVVFTAQGSVWVRFVDGAGQTLFEREMAAGESYTLPASAQGTRLNTGRPDLLAISIGGRRIAPLSDQPITLADAPVDAGALLAREAAPEPVPVPAAGLAVPAGQANARPVAAGNPAPRPVAARAPARPSPEQAVPPQPLAPQNLLPQPAGGSPPSQAGAVPAPVGLPAGSAGD